MYECEVFCMNMSMLFFDIYDIVLSIYFSCFYNAPHHFNLRIFPSFALKIKSFEPHHEETNNLHMRKQRSRSSSQ